MSEKIYLKIDQRRFVKKPKVTIGDAMTVYCSDKDMIEKIGHITLVEFTLGKYDRKVFDALDVVGIIQKEYPDADIECLGECDFVVEYKKPEKEGTVHWIKVAVICFITMVGSGYGIIAYNNDVSTTDIFDRVYELLGASFSASAHTPRRHASSNGLSRPAFLRRSVNVRLPPCTV